MFSKACTYGIKALGVIAKESLKGRRVKVHYIAKQTSSPKAFTAKVLQKLVKGKIVNSVKGPKGGFEIDKERLHKLRLVDIVYAIDGEDYYNRCVLDISSCNHTNPCELHEPYSKVMHSFNQMIHETTLLELADKSLYGEEE